MAVLTLDQLDEVAAEIQLLQPMQFVLLVSGFHSINDTSPWQPNAKTVADITLNPRRHQPEMERLAGLFLEMRLQGRI